MYSCVSNYLYLPSVDNFFSFSNCIPLVKIDFHFDSRGSFRMSYLVEIQFISVADFFDFVGFE